MEQNKCHLCMKEVNCFCDECLKAAEDEPLEYETVAVIHRNGKEIAFFLKCGEVLSFENIVDVEVFHQDDEFINFSRLHFDTD